MILPSSIEFPNIFYHKHSYFASIHHSSNSWVGTNINQVVEVINTRIGIRIRMNDLYIDWFIISIK